MFSILAISSLTSIIAIFFWYRTFNKYRIGNFPCPPSYFLLGHVPFLSRPDKILPYIHEQLLKYNGLIKLYFGQQVVLYASDREFLKWLLNSPIHLGKSDEYRFMKDWLGEGLVLSNGSHWKLHRKILTPAFHFKMIENHINTVNNTISIFIEKLGKHVGNSSVDIYPLITSFTLDAVCESTMATSVNAQEDDKFNYKESVHHLCRIFYGRFISITKRSDFLFQLYPDYKISKHAIESLNAFIISAMKNRRKELEKEKNVENKYERKKTPFIDILLNAKDENGENWSDQDILDEVNTFIFGSYETSASALSFALYNLAQNPDVQARALEEQRILFGSEKNPNVTLTNLNDMTYLDLVIKESLRLHSAIPLMGRTIAQDTYYDGKLLPAGLTIIMCLHTLHNDPKLFPEPEKFDPSRFENDTNLPFSYLPFSAGQRNCIGQKFAMYEVKQAVSAVLRNFELLPSPNYSIEIVAELSLKSSNGVCIKLKDRKY